MKYTLLLATLLVGCSGGSDAPAGSRSVSIDSHGHDETVVGTIALAGSASGGDVVVWIDDRDIPAVMDGGAWSLAVDTTEWVHGWHTLQARVGDGVDSVAARLDLFFAGGRTGEEDNDPPVVAPAPPVVGAPASGLVAHWSFVDGTARDDSGNGLDGTVYGATAAAGGFTFDGIDDLIRVPDQSSAAPASIANLGQGTISVRFRYDGVDNNGTAAETLGLLYLGANEANATSAADGVSIYVAHGRLNDPRYRQVYFTVVEHGDVTLCFDTTATLEQGRTYTYTVCVAPGDHHAYLDGIEVARHYNAGTSIDDHAFFADVTYPDMLAFGRHDFAISGNWWHHNGAIDDVAIYDTVLAPSEVELIASAP
jgi:hypothetical protein